MVTTTCVINDQIESARTALRLMLAEAEKTRRATAVTPPLWYVTSTLKKVIDEVEGNGGVERFDPEFSGIAAEKFTELSRIIQRVIAHNDNLGILDRIPAKMFFHRLQSQGRRLWEMALILKDIDDRWQEFLGHSAQATLDELRHSILAADESDEGHGLSDADLDRPSDGALRAHLHRTVSASRQ